MTGTSPEEPPAGAPLGKGTGFTDHEVSDWKPLHDLPWHQRWRRGWRLALVLVAVPVVYGVVRGPADYRLLKQWRARHWLELMQQAPTRETQLDYLQKAAGLAPDYERVVRAVADFYEKQGDGMALQALQHLKRTGRESPLDLNRRVRLALGLHQLDEEMRQALLEWSQTDPAVLEPERVVLSSRWLAGLGRPAEAVNRLAQKIGQETAGKIRNGLLMTKAQLLLQGHSLLGTAEAVPEAWEILAGLAQEPEAETPLREEAIFHLTDSLRRPATWQGVLTPEITGVLVQVLGGALEETASPRPPQIRVKLDLTRTALRMADRPLEAAVEISALCGRWKDSPMECRLEVMRWLNQEERFAEAAAWADRADPPRDNRDWLIARLDALFAVQDWDAVEKWLADTPEETLSGLMRRLFLYRAAAARKAADAPARRQAFLKETATGDPVEVLYAAGNLEVIRDFEGALQLFRQLKDQEGMATAARQGMVRCLSAYPERVYELIDALESLVSQEPNLTEARGDLAYLRAIEDRAQAEDYETLQALAREFPQFLSYRTGAALAFLKQNDPAAALAAYQGSEVDWAAVPISWRLVRAAVLTANQRPQEAAALVAGVDQTKLKPGERQLLRQRILSPTP